MALTDLLKADSLPSWFPLHHFLDSTPYVYETPGSVRLVDWTKGSLWAAVGMVLFNPIFWNVVARNEYRNKIMTKTLGSPYLGCYALAVAIFSLGIFRDLVYERALRAQPHLAILSHPLVQAAAYALIALGQLFVITSIYALGITGTYLGDYFGILMKARVTGFPFNVLNDPMYVGSTLAFAGTALLYRSVAGLGISALVWVVYTIALKYEGPFTDRIYSAAAAKKTDSAPSSSAAPSKNPSATSTSPASPARKSSRLQNKKSHESLRQPGESYAAAAKRTPSPEADALAPEKLQTQPTPGPSTAQTPRARRIRKESGIGAGTASPARMTRSRSKGRLTDAESEAD